MALHPQEISSVTVSELQQLKFSSVVIQRSRRKLLIFSRKLKKEEWISFLNEYIKLEL
jgi:hypothetical protein